MPPPALRPGGRNLPHRLCRVLPTAARRHLLHRLHGQQPLEARLLPLRHPKALRPRVGREEDRPKGDPERWPARREPGKGRPGRRRRDGDLQGQVDRGLLRPRHVQAANHRPLPGPAAGLPPGAIRPLSVSRSLHHPQSGPQLRGRPDRRIPRPARPERGSADPALAPTGRTPTPLLWLEALGLAVAVHLEEGSASRSPGSAPTNRRRSYSPWRTPASTAQGNAGTSPPPASD
jgi:hypothetical protein